MKNDSKKGSLESARIADVPLFDSNDLSSIVKFTGLPLQSDVSEAALLHELNSLVLSSITSQYKVLTTSAELRETLKALQKYDELSRRLSNSEYPPLCLNRTWFRRARTRLFELETEFALNTQPGPKEKNMLHYQFVPQALGLYSAAFDRKPVSTTPYPDEKDETRARGSTVKFIRKVLGLAYDEIKRRHSGSPPTSLDIFNPNMKTDRTISDWIVKALNYKRSGEDALTSESGSVLDHSDWRQAKETYLRAIKLESVEESG